MRFFLFALFVPILFLVNSCSEQKLSRPQVAFYQAHGPTQAALHFWPYIYLVRKYESYSLDLKKAYRYTPEYSDNIHFNAADNYIEFVPLKQGPAYLRLYDGDSLRYELRIEIGADSRKDETGRGLETSLRFLNHPCPPLSLWSPDRPSLAREALRGKIVVMNFWATLCVPCRQEIPELNKLKAGFAGDSQILFVACNTDDSVRTNQSTGALEQLAYVQDMTRNEEYTKWEPFNYPLDSFSFRHYFRARPLLDSLIPSSGIPVTLVLDERGIIRDIHTGYRVDHMQELLGNKIRELQARQVPR